MKYSWLTRSVVVLSLVSMLTDISSEMLYPVMPVYLQSIGFSVLLIGVLEGIAEATAGLSKGYFGKRSDVSGKRLPFVQWGYLLSALSKPMMALLTWKTWIFGARTIDRLGKGIRTGARDALLSDESSIENKGKVFGFHRSLDTVGAAIGPIIALAYLHFNPGNYATLFYLAFIPGLAGVALTFLIKEKKFTPAKPKSAGTFFSFISYWKTSGSNYRLLVGGLLAFTLFNSSDIFLLLIVKSKGFSDEQVLMVYIFYNLVYALAAYPAGFAGDRLGLKNVLITGTILFSIAYGGMIFAGSTWQIYLLFFIYGLYAAFTEGISKALISSFTPREETATAIGFYAGFNSIFLMLASSIAGLIWHMRGDPDAFLIFSSAGATGVALYFILLIKNPRHRKA